MNDIAQFDDLQQRLAALQAERDQGLIDFQDFDRDYTDIFNEAQARPLVAPAPPPDLARRPRVGAPPTADPTVDKPAEGDGDAERFSSNVEVPDADAAPAGPANDIAQFDDQGLITFEDFDRDHTDIFNEAQARPPVAPAPPPDLARRSRVGAPPTADPTVPVDPTTEVRRERWRQLNEGLITFEDFDRETRDLPLSDLWREDPSDVAPRGDAAPKGWGGLGQQAGLPGGPLTIDQLKSEEAALAADHATLTAENRALAAETGAALAPYEEYIGYGLIGRDRDGNVIKGQPTWYGPEDLRLEYNALVVGFNGEWAALDARWDNYGLRANTLNENAAMHNTARLSVLRRLEPSAVGPDGKLDVVDAYARGITESEIAMVYGVEAARDWAFQDLPGAGEGRQGGAERLAGAGTQSPGSPNGTRRRAAWTISLTLQSWRTRP